MTRTTELLKEIEILSKELNIVQQMPELYGQLRLGTLLCQYKSELRGRLDALKEEEEFLETLFQMLDADEFNDIGKHIDNRLASIQEEIKLIEGAI